MFFHDFFPKWKHGGLRRYYAYAFRDLKTAFRKLARQYHPARVFPELTGGSLKPPPGNEDDNQKSTMNVH